MSSRLGNEARRGPEPEAKQCGLVGAQQQVAEGFCGTASLRIGEGGGVA